jgi:hypothetical protein
MVAASAKPQAMQSAQNNCESAPPLLRPFICAINGTPMCELDDRDTKPLGRGWLALQVHVGPPMRVQFTDIYLKRP